ncbi:hypothetical protein [Campylobacter cuniculorum]|uniref:Uncharacterized protein n=2 Tax=Campylobacter cuniculorum TaxID=374106 RepID=A0A1W6BV10_9BACT|nr:hypothetical protein [Campylobacter cuniculorum]ARJ55918.1 hypothetical protein CCUN_0263 [Campylobacter cuniculorum DSM 23162 = LMG 24588]QOR05136.1 hypothetical protein A0071_04185 [Campylobacter cuniculorum]
MNIIHLRRVLTRLIMACFIFSLALNLVLCYKLNLAKKLRADCFHMQEHDVHNIIFHHKTLFLIKMRVSLKLLTLFFKNEKS